MTVPELKALWSHALDTADAALDAGRIAGTVGPAFYTVERRQIRTERQWLAQIAWPIA